MKKGLFTRLSVLVFILTAGFVCTACSKKASFEKPPIPVKIQVVESAFLDTGLKYSATLAPREQVDLAFKVGGYVQEIIQLKGPDDKARDVQKGDRVSKTTVLARLRDNDYQAKLNHAKASLEESKASLAQAVREFERAERLLNENVVAKNEFDKAKEKLDVTQARTRGAASQVEEAQIQLQDTVLSSPLDCVVVSRFIERGTLVSSGTRAFVLADLSSVKAVFGVPDLILQKVRLGGTLVVMVEALHNKEFQGVITAVSPSADPKSRVFEVEVTIANHDLDLKDGMIAAVRLDGETQDTSLPVVPLNSVVRPPDDPQGYMVFAIEDLGGRQIARGRRVTVARVFANKAAVSGLLLGEKIVTTGATLLFEGSAVNVIP